jgi:hypothetical protein
VEGKLENIWPRSKYETTFLTTFLQSEQRTIHYHYKYFTLSYKKPKQKIKIIAKYIFRPVFCSFLLNFVISQLPVSSGHEDFLEPLLSYLAENWAIWQQCFYPALHSGLGRVVPGGAQFSVGV